MRTINREIIDVHAHIIPGVDDGARDIEEACRMLRSAYEQGVRAVIATPHSHHGQDAGRMKALFDQLVKRAENSIPELHLYLGQEILYSESVAEQLQKGRLWTMAGGRYVLIEFMPAVSYRVLYRGIRQLLEGGYRPILAHMERYACLREEENLKDLAGSGCWLQMNYESLQGSMLHGDTRWCRKQVRAGRIQLLGSDMHRMDYRPPVLGAALGWLADYVDEELIDAMVYTNPGRITGFR